MNITILSNKDLASNFALNLLLPELAEHTVHVFLSSRVGNPSKKIPEDLENLRFFEQHLFTQAIFPLIDSAGETSNQQALKTFEQLAQYLAQPITELNNINSSAGLHIIANTQPDLILSIRYGVILHNEIIALPTHGVINLHSGLLPHYRGVMATFWAMLKGENTIGTTLHYINDSTIDTGNIIANTSLSVDPTRSYLWHVLQLYVEGIKTINNTVSLLSNKKTLDVSVQTNSGHYYTFPNENDLATFKSKGYQIVNAGEIIDIIKHYA